MFKRVYIGLGSNLGNRRYKLCNAIKLLNSCKGIKVIRRSPVYETAPIGPKQNNFLNAAVEIETELSPMDLLGKLKEIERALGRRKSGLKWGPRPIDLDILFYGRQTVRMKGLVIPHKEMPVRLFVLAPLKDIASGFIHPAAKKTVRRMFEELSSVPDGQQIKYYGGL